MKLDNLARSLTGIATKDGTKSVRVLIPADMNDPAGEWLTAEVALVEYGGAVYIMVDPAQTDKANFGVTHFARQQTARS